MKIPLKELESIARKYAALNDCLTEKGKRLWAAAESLSYGHGGTLLVSQATDIARSTIHRGIKEIQKGNTSSEKGIRKTGGGRKKSSEKQKKINRSFRCPGRAHFERRSRIATQMDM